MILPKVRDPRFVTIRRGGTLTDADHHLLALWAASCAEHVVHLFESAGPGDRRPRQAIEHARAWVRGEVGMRESRAAGGHAMGAARDKQGAARHAAYAAGQAGAVAHVAAHELGAAAYAIKAARAAVPVDEAAAAGRRECRWQRDQLPEAIRVGSTGLALYGRRLWETMSSHWPTADQQPGATPAQIEFAGRWRDMPKMVFSSTIDTVDGNTRLVGGDAVTEITRLRAEDGSGPMDIGGATLAAAAMRAGLIDEYAIVTHPVLVGGGTPFFTALDNWVNLNLMETRTFPSGVVLTRYETRR